MWGILERFYQCSFCWLAVWVPGQDPKLPERKPIGVGVRVWGFRVWGFRVQGSGFGGLGFRVQGLQVWVQSFRAQAHVEQPSGGLRAGAYKLEKDNDDSEHRPQTVAKSIWQSKRSRPDCHSRSMPEAPNTTP